MNVVVLKHAPFERLGQIEVWLQAKSASVETVVLYEPTCVILIWHPRTW